MKKTTVITIIVVGIAAVLLMLMQNGNMNRLGTESYYVQVNEGKKIEGNTSTGEKYKTYEYTVQGYDKHGSVKTLTFTAAKELRKEAYLRLYVKTKGVSSYQEVHLDDIPEKTRMLLSNPSSKE
ncbi:YxeA family protein [Paenibacillus sp. OAS669]|uniref:YxeA family protein n=1 Tax=Paenibacillus sp. OAS669 TaxID=2663821 RepID=UPI001789DDA6|nr:YxeA family protein [Paenibacillus sp. OAS669]MBE1442088.1 uncharacterized protein (TIGR01655 family) [Paenibacillus sp. OAS669]